MNNMDKLDELCCAVEDLVLQVDDDAYMTQKHIDDLDNSLRNQLRKGWDARKQAVISRYQYLTGLMNKATDPPACTAHYKKLVKRMYPHVLRVLQMTNPWEKK
jgi:hypothetical protein